MIALQLDAAQAYQRLEVARIARQHLAELLVRTLERASGFI